MAQTEKEILDYWMKKDSLGLNWTQEDRIIFAMRDFAYRLALQQPTISKTEKVQTAVEWLFEKITSNFWDIKECQHLLEQAKQMEKEQIIKSYNSYPQTIDINDGGDFKLLSGEQYYNETYKKD